MDLQREKQPDISLEITPQLSNLVLVRKIINSLADDIGFSPDESLKLEIAVDEACSNSIISVQRCSNSIISKQRKVENDPKVRLEISVHESHLQLAVVDSGDCFQDKYEKALPFHDGTDRTRKRGYGLQIIKTFMDEVDYFHEPAVGNRLILTKYIKSVD